MQTTIPSSTGGHERAVTHTIGGRLTRAQIFCKVAVLIADGLPAPADVGIRVGAKAAGDGELAITMQCVAHADVPLWAGAVGARLGTPHDGIVSASTFDWYGHYVYVVAYEQEDDAPAAVEDDDLSKVREIASVDGSPSDLDGPPEDAS